MRSRCAFAKATDTAAKHKARYGMKNNKKRIYIKIVDALEASPKTRREIIDAYVNSLGLTREELADRNTKSRANIERSAAGIAINEMRQLGMITRNDDGVYFAHDQKPVIIRKERCESEIFRMLGERPMTKGAIRSELLRALGADKTVTERDDNKLFSYMGDVLRDMSARGAVRIDGKYYSLSPKLAAKADDISELLELKNSYLTRLHRKGGEFFEVYFMTMLEKYMTQLGKSVISNTVTAGAADGGIDGIMETVDQLGFRETIMVQTKNRSDMTVETTVRGFYGAVCARQGSRGMFVTSSDFHPAATAFLDSIDNCVGIDGSRLFEMACKTHYGIKRVGTELYVDDKII